MCLAIPGESPPSAAVTRCRAWARWDFGGIQKDVNLCCVPEAKVGDYVIVHVGFALSRVDESEANAVFEYLREMGELLESKERGP